MQQNLFIAEFLHSFVVPVTEKVPHSRQRYIAFPSTCTVYSPLLESYLLLTSLSPSSHLVCSLFPSFHTQLSFSLLLHVQYALL